MRFLCRYNMDSCNYLHEPNHCTVSSCLYTPPTLLLIITVLSGKLNKIKTASKPLSTGHQKSFLQQLVCGKNKARQAPDAKLTTHLISILLKSSHDHWKDCHSRTRWKPPVPAHFTFCACRLAQNSSATFPVCPDWLPAP